MSDTLDDSLSVLAADAVRRPEKFGPYCEFLSVVAEAGRHADAHQRGLIRSFVAQHPGGFTPEEATAAIQKIMGWE